MANDLIQLGESKQTMYGWQFKTVIGDAVEGTMQRSITITRIA